MSEKHILLINPWIYDFAAYDLWIKPIGLLAIGSVLEKFGYTTNLIDCLDRFHPLQQETQGNYKAVRRKYGTGKFRREPVEKPKILADIPRTYCRYGISLQTFITALSEISEPNVILVTSGMTYWYPGPFAVIELVKAKYPRVPVILGGIYATLYHDHAVCFSGADYVIAGEGEEKALRLVDELTGHHSDWSQFPTRWRDLPEPTFKHYSTLTSMVLMTSKGCPYNCSFCASRLLCGKFEQKDPQQILDTISYYYYKWRIRHFAFIDDALLIDQQMHLSKILTAVIEKNIRLTFHTPNGIQPKEITAELATIMFHSGFKTIRLSYETSNKNRQGEMNNKVSDEALASALDHFEWAGYRRKDISVYVLMGLPGQLPDEVVKSMIFVSSLGAKISLASYSPIPGTKDWERSVKEHGFPEDADPLLTNNTIYPLRNKQFTYEQFQHIRQFSKVINYGLDHGVNFFNDSSLTNNVKSALTHK